MIGNKLRNILKEKNLSQIRLAKIINIPQSTFTKWVNNYSEPSTDDLKKIAHALNVPVSYFLEDIDLSNPQLITDLVKVPIIGEIPAGMPLEAVENYIDAVYIPKEFIGNKRVFGLSVKGDSMAPRIEEGDYVLICPDVCCENKDVVAFRVNCVGDVTLKRLIKTDGMILLKPDNPSYDPIVVTPEITIIGKVVYMVRKRV